MSQSTNTETGSQTSVPLLSSGENASSTTSATPTFNSIDMLSHTIGELHNLKNDVQELKKITQKRDSFYSSTARLNLTVQIVTIILIIIPLIQIIACTIIIHYLGIEDKLPLLKWALGGISFFSILELFIGGIKLYLHDNKLNELEKKIEQLSN